MGPRSQEEPRTSIISTAKSTTPGRSLPCQSRSGSSQKMAYSSKSGRVRQSAIDKPASARATSARSQEEKEKPQAVIYGGMKMNVSKEELLHIADLSDLIIEENEVGEYLKNLQEILEFANTINSVNVKLK